MKKAVFLTAAALLFALLLTVSLSASGYVGYDYVLPMKYESIVIGEKNIYFSLGGKWGITSLDGTVTSEAIYSSYREAASRSAEIKKSSYFSFAGENGLFGYKNGAGETVIPAKYEIVSDTFENGAAIVRLGGKYGLIDMTGAVRFDFVCDTLIKADSCARYAYTQNGKTGFIDGGFNITAAPFLSAEAVTMYDNYVVYRASGGKYGLAAYDGEILSGPIWDYMRGFSEGLAAVGVNEDFYGINVRWGYINESGEIVIPVIYFSRGTEALDFSEGLAGVCDGEAGIYIDRNANVCLRLPSGCYPHTGFSGGAAAISQGLEKRYIDTTGATVMASSDGVKWYNADKLKNGLAVISSYFDSFTTGAVGVIRYRGSSPSSWAADEVKEAAEAGLIPSSFTGGYTGSVSRAEYCRFAVNLIKVFSGKEPSELAEIKSGIFTDTDDESVLYAQAMGIVDGRGNGVFDPNGALNRQEAAKILINTFKVCAYLPSHTAAMPAYSDRDSIEAWAREGIWYNGEWGVMIGVGDGRFDPLGSYTREQSILTMLRLYKALLVNRPVDLYINPDLSVYYKDTVNSHSSVYDYTVRVRLPASWKYNYTTGDFTSDGKVVATLSKAAVYIDGLPEKPTGKGVYTFDSDIVRVTLTFANDYSEAKRFVSETVIYDRRSPAFDESREDFLRFLYRDAAEAMSWFEINTLYSRVGLDAVIESYRVGTQSGALSSYETDDDGFVKLRAPQFPNYAALESYLKSLFSDEIAARLLGTGMYKDIDGELWGLDAARGTDITVGSVEYSFTAESDTKIIYTAVYERLGDDLSTVKAHETRNFVCEKLSGAWKWTAFELFY